MIPPQNCPACGEPLPVKRLGGLCPACIKKVSFASLDSRDAKTSTTEWEPPTVAELTALLPAGVYSVEQIIGRGGMGAVYRGTQKRLQRSVAIKVLRRDFAGDAVVAERFQREALMMAKLSHPNIVNVIDCGDAGPSLLYIVMECVDGADLLEVIRSGGMTQERALQIIPQICDALQFAHDRGIIHRDIKPSNILLTREGRVKIADFGLAKLSQPEGEPRTQVGTSVGTPEYAAPEQLTSSDGIDHRADIYSLGVMLYQMLTGEIPRGAWPLPSKSAPVDPRWDEVVVHAMQQRPADRYLTATELKKDVSRIGPHLPGQRSWIKPAWIFGVLLIAAAGSALLFQNFRQVAAGLPGIHGGGVGHPDEKGDLLHGGHRYRFVQGMHPWSFAKAQAERLGGHLAVITSAEENDAIESFMREKLGAQYQSCWLGAFRENDGTPWQWVSGEQFDFSDWGEGSGEPTTFPAAAKIWRPTANSTSLDWLRWQPNEFDKHGSEAWQGYLVEWETTNLPAQSKHQSHVRASMSAPFTNSLGMKFVPVTATSSGNPVLFSIWETRRSDYEAFARARREVNAEWRAAPNPSASPSHPVVMVSWEDAVEFCQWLTDSERAAKTIGSGDSYRLPSDLEWSAAVGLRDERGDSPRARGRKPGSFPWGKAWPPPAGVGNFLDESSREYFANGNDAANASHTAGVPIEGYRDGYPLTAPVGSFRPNELGLHDLTGNACEWCADLFGPGERLSMARVLRGGGWNEGRNQFEGLRLGFRYEGPMRRLPTRGFRAVLETAR